MCFNFKKINILKADAVQSLLGEFFLRVVFIVCALMVPFNNVRAEFSLVSPSLNRTYIQLNARYANWSTEDWEELFLYFKQLKLSQVVVQWTVYDLENFAGGASSSLNDTSVLDTIMRLADASQIKIFLGLVYRSDYWQKIDKDSATKKDFLEELSRASIKTADELAAKFGHRPSFYGWYITEEIDDINWSDKESRQILRQYLKSLSEYLYTLTPNKAIAVSGFSNAVMSPQQLRVFWQEILQGTHINTIFFQDGIGVNKLQLNNLPRYLEAMRNVSSKESCKLEIVVEIFFQTGGPPLNDGMFETVPASLKRIKHQISIAQRYSSNIIAFSVPEYMTPSGGQQAENLYNDYLRSIRSSMKMMQNF